MTTKHFDLGTEIPADVQNVTTVQDAAARLREALSLSRGAETSYVAKARQDLEGWIEHARGTIAARDARARYVEHFDRGLEILTDARRVADRGIVVYFDEGTQTWWSVEDDEVVELGRRLAADEDDEDAGSSLVSLWCASSVATELPICPAKSVIRELAEEAAIAGDDEMVAVCGRALQGVTADVIDVVRVLDNAEAARDDEDDLRAASTFLGVQDADGRAWIPDDEAAAEIVASEHPGTTARRICRTEPDRGVWK